MSGKFALIIGNSEYSDPRLARLHAPGKDAEAFAGLLKAPDLASFDDVITLINQSSYEARSAIARFLRDRKPEDLLLLYFSGHGVRDEQGRLFLATKDTDNTILDATAIPADFVTRLMDNCRSKRQVLILDCCNSGAFAYGTKAAAGGSMGTGSAFEGNGYGRVVLTATDATQFAYEGDQVIGSGTSDSLFTHFLIKGLEGEADANGDGVISVDELYDYACGQIRSLTPKQQPEKFAYHQQEQLILSTKVKPQTVKPLPLNDPDLEVDLQSTRPYTREGAVRELGAILNGKNLGRALTAQNRLKEIIANDDSRAVIKVAEQILAEYDAAHGIPVKIVEPKPVEPPPAPPLPPEPWISEGPPPSQPPQSWVSERSPEPEPVRPVTPEFQKRPVPAETAVETPVPAVAEPRPKLDKRLMIGIGGIAVIGLLIGGILFAQKGMIPAPAPTATATRTAVRPTLTLRPSSTPSRTPTPVATLARLLMDEEFVDASNGWWTGTDSNSYLKRNLAITGGEYVWNMTAEQGFLHREIPSDAPVVSDFSAAATSLAAYQVGNGGYGVVFRYQEKGSKVSYYYFGVADWQRSYYLSLWDKDAWKTLIYTSRSSAIQPDRANEILVVGSGSEFTFYINNQLVGRTTDSTLSSGKCGLAVELNNPGDAAIFRFKNFILRTPG